MERFLKISFSYLRQTIETRYNKEKKKEGITCGWKQIENGEPFPQVSGKLMPVENYETASTLCARLHTAR